MTLNGWTLWTRRLAIPFICVLTWSWLRKESERHEQNHSSRCRVKPGRKFRHAGSHANETGACNFESNSDIKL